MAKVILFSIACFIAHFSFSQKVLDPKLIQKSKVPKRLCIDTSGFVSNGCPVDLLELDVVFYQAIYDSRAKSLRLIGRTCLSSGLSNGFGGIGIFQGKLVNYRFEMDTVLSESTIDQDGKNSGFFDVTVSLEKGEQLIYKNQAFPLVVYDLSKLRPYLK